MLAASLQLTQTSKGLHDLAAPAGLVTMILLRTLRNDYAKYTRDDDDLESLERDISEESGWKLVHGDVFRAPRHLWLLSALLGTGVQLAMLALSTILITIAGQPG